MAKKAGIEVTYSVSGLEQALTEKLQAIKHRAPLMRELSNLLLDAVFDNFSDGGRPKWAPLKPATIRRKARAGREKPLIMSRHLQNSIRAQSDNDNAVVGTNVEYARIHQEGGTITQKPRQQSTFHKKRKDGSISPRFARKSKTTVEKIHHVGERRITIPARPFLAITDEDRRKIEAAMRAYFEQTLNGK